MDKSFRSLVALVVVSVFCLVGSLHAGTTIQFDVKSLLNIRVVTTYTNGKVVTFDQGVDGWDGEATFAAADAMGSNNGHCMNNDGRYAATTSHPDIKLNYADTGDAKASQARKFSIGEEVAFAVPAGSYSWLGGYFMSSSGPSSVRFTLVYSDNTTAFFSATIPDWYPGDLTGKPSYMFLVASDLAKWDVNNERPEADKHSLYGVSVPVNKAKNLVQIKLKQQTGGYLTFWGATGVQDAVASVVDEAIGGGPRAILVAKRTVRLSLAGNGGSWMLADGTGRILSRGWTGEAAHDIELPDAGVYFLRAGAKAGERIFRFVAQ